MKTAVSIPDQVFKRAERLAKRLGLSRSALYGKALADYVAKRSPAAVTAALNALVDSGDLAVDPFVEQAADLTLRPSAPASGGEW